MKTHTIKLNATFRAKPKDVFSALTDARKISVWTGQKAKVGTRKGGKFEMFDGWVKGKVVAFSRGKNLAYTWRPAEWKKATPSSVVRYKLSNAPGGTRVTLTHSGLPDAKEYRNHRSGWTQVVFKPLKKYFRNK
ncbi:MAG TPA: SRPBCC domain-containing protein [Bacteroidota bacterium]|nr:SRPBCC domain-containing protein [Bacteroidota bacterium]